MLEAQNITVSYDDREAVSNVSFALRNGEITVLIGANGAGKTTLIRALNGALPVSKGEILLDGKRLVEFSRREIARKIAVVAQETETKFPITAREFILAGRFAHGSAFGWESEQDVKRAKDTLEICDLKVFENRLMNQLSGGERQRVVLARALATEAKILLLDEPTANLDLAHQALMFRLIRQRCVESESSAVIITHDLNLACAFADRILLLKRGKVIAKGKPVEVLTKANLREAFNVEVFVDENPQSKKLRVTTIYQ